MTEWEQLKKEYREIPIPAEGKHQVLQAMADAKKKRNRFRNVVKYGTMVAAAMLVILLIPGMMLFSGGFGATKEDASMEADFVTQSTGNAGWSKQESADGAARIPTSNNFAAPEQGYGVTEDAVEETEMAKDAAVPWLYAREAISKEILRQMEERMQNEGETYYRKSEEYPEGFELLEQTQFYYINEEGLLVIVFQPGEVAPEEQGVIEFVIPQEVFSLTE